jgi:hypothetical protein
MGWISDTKNRVAGQLTFDALSLYLFPWLVPQILWGSYHSTPNERIIKGEQATLQGHPQLECHS